jgi:hypothetical protein
MMRDLTTVGIIMFVAAMAFLLATYAGRAVVLITLAGAIVIVTMLYSLGLP